MAVGRIWSPRSTEAIPLHTCLEAHVSTAICHVLRLSCANHILRAVQAVPLTRCGLPSHISRLNHVTRLVHVSLARCRWSICGFRC